MRAPRMALAVLCTAQFVDVLDGTAVLVALPALGRDLGLHDAGLQWVVTAYVLVFGGCLLAAGRLADALGRRRVLVAGMALFAAASAACGAAPTGAVLVAARALQGLGAALTAPAALAMIVDAFPAGRPRERAVAAWTGVAAAGGAAGLILGGLITAALGWRWVFLVNVPVGLATLALAPRALAGVGDAPRARGRAGGRAGELDLPGAAAATAGLGLLVLAAAQAQQAGPLAPGTLAALGGAALACAGFAWRERTAARPLVPPALLRERPLAVALAVSAALTATTSGGAVLATLQLQDVLGLGPAGAAAALLPFSLAVVAGSALASRVRAAPPGVVAGGLGLVAAASVTAAAGLSPLSIAAWGALAGLGLGAASVATTTLGASAVADADRGAAAALLNAAAQVGTALGVAALVLLAGTTSATAGHRLGFAAAAGLAGLAAALAGRALRQDRAGATRCDEVPSTTTRPA